MFQAEVFAIRKTAEAAQNINRPHDVVSFFVDSQAAIRSMQSSTVRTKNVMANREALDSLSTTKSVRIYWVPSHQGIDGNEAADVLAKEGVESVETERITCLSHSERYKEPWRNRRTREQKAGGETPRLAESQELRAKSAASHATKLGILNSRTCRKCDESGAIESLEHLICN